MTKLLRVVALGAALPLFAAGGAHATDFTNIIDPANPTFTQALGINNSNTIVGYGNATDFDGFVLTLPPVPGNFTRENYPSPSPPGSAFFTQVVGIDAAGDTVGFYVTNPTVGTTSGFFKSAASDGFVTVDQPGSVFNQLLAINQSGNVAAGYSSFTDPAGMTGQEAFTVSSSLVYFNINALLPPNFNSQATGINNVGSAVGFYQYNATGDFSAFLSTEGGLVSFQFPGSVSTQALGINDEGEIVGDYISPGGDMFGFLDKDGVFSTLDPFSSVAVTVNGINDKGDIVGFYTNASTDSVIGFVGTPVPEASTWAMLLAGFAGIGFLGYRKTLKGMAAA